MWRKLIGVAIIVFGVCLTARGLWQWKEPPHQPSPRYWWASRQMEDVTWGPMSGGAVGKGFNAESLLSSLASEKSIPTVGDE
jgi:hypothetical protein